MSLEVLMSRYAWILLPLFTACGSGPGPDKDEDTEVADSEVTEDSEAMDDSEEPADSEAPGDTEPAGPTVLWSQSFESPTLAAGGSMALGGSWEGRSSNDGYSGAVVARSDSNEVGSAGPAPVQGSQYLALRAQAGTNGSFTVRTRHEVILDIVAAMEEGTTYTLTGSFARLGDFDLPSMAAVRLFEPTQKGQLTDASWPASSAGAAASVSNASPADDWQSFSVSFTGTPGNAGQPLRLGLLIESGEESYDTVMVVDALELTAE